MPERDHDLFPELDPLPGGLTRMRARLDEETRPSRRLTLVAGLGVAAALILLVFLDVPRATTLVPASHPAARSEPLALQMLVAGVDDPGLVAMGLAPVPAEIVSRAPASTEMVHFRRVPTTSDEVVFYVAEATRP